MKETCPSCDREYERLGQHWSYSPSHRPELTDKQKEVIVGLMMGDGSVNRQNGRNPRIKVKMVNKEYLQHLDNIFGILSTGVSLKATAKENAKNKRQSGFRPEACHRDYHDLYEWTSRTHPALEEFANWYSSGEKVWPRDIDLTPTVLTHWYVGDGHYANKSGNNYIEIAMNNEVENTEKVSDIFENAGIPSPNSYNIRESEREYKKRCCARFSVTDSQLLFGYMKPPLPGFAYKWP